MEQERRHGGTSRVEPSDVKEDRPAEDSSFSILRNNVTEAIRILVLRRWVFVIPFCIITCLAAIGSHWIPRKYQSTTVIERRDHTVLINLRQTVATGGFAGFFRPTLVRDLRSLDGMTEVVERAGLVPDLQRGPDGALTEGSSKRCRAKAAALVGGVNVQLVQRTDHLDQIKISFTGSDPNTPQRIVDEVKNTYIRRVRARLAEILRDGKTYFDERAAEQREAIAVLEEDMLTFQAEYIGIDPTNPGALKLKLTSLESERTGLDREIASLDREIAARRGLLESYAQRRRTAARTGPEPIAPQMATSLEAQTLEKEIRRLQGEIHDFRITRRMTDRHPDIVERNRRIGRLRGELKQQYLADARTLPGNRGVSIDDDLAGSAAEAAIGFDTELAGIRIEIQDRENRAEVARNRLLVVERDIAKHSELRNNIFRHRKEYELKADVLEQTRTAYRANAQRSNELASILNADESDKGISFTELTPPTACATPVNPRGTTAVVMALLAGLAAGAVSVLLRELFDQTYHTTRQVTRSLGIAILESVDEIVTSADRARLFRRRVIYAPAVLTLLVTTVGMSCATAYLSLERPALYQRVMTVPTELLGRIRDGRLFAGPSPVNDDAQPAAAPASEPTFAAAEWASIGDD